MVLYRTNFKNTCERSARRRETLEPEVCRDEVPPLREDEIEEYGQEEEEEEVAQIPFKMARYKDEEAIDRSRKFYIQINQRRTCRMFSTAPVCREVIENIIRTAGEPQLVSTENTQLCIFFSVHFSFARIISLPTELILSLRQSQGHCKTECRLEEKSKNKLVMRHRTVLFFLLVSVLLL